MLLFGNPTPTLIVSTLIAVLIGMTIHEFAHNYVAHLMGDPVPAREGRLTLDPMVHIYWPGFIMFVLIGFGILGSAPISAARMRNPRWGFLAAVAAGPFSNLLTATVFAMLYHLSSSMPDTVSNVLVYIVFWNVLLFVFNLLPMFPIDGWHMVLSLLPAEHAIWWERNAQNTQMIFFGFLMLSFLRLPGVPNAFGLLIGEPTFFILDVLQIGI